MTRPRRYRESLSFQLVTLDEIAKELGRTQWQTKKALGKLGFTGIKAKRKIGEVQLYNAKVLDVIKGLYGVPHRDVTDPGNDWLTKFLNNQPLEDEGENDDRGNQNRTSPDQTGQTRPGNRRPTGPER